MNREAQALDRAILDWISRWTQGSPQGEDDFTELAVRIFAYQLDHNVPYARFAATRGYTRTTLPVNWREIPAVPSSAFKDAVLFCGDPTAAALRFQTSGTSASTAGTHYMESAALYDAALVATFDRYMLADAPAPMRYLMLVPDPRERPTSSLGFMMGEIEGVRATSAAWYVRGDSLNAPAALEDLATAAREGVPVCIATTAFALVHLIEAAQARGIRVQSAPGSRMMETGGFKGRSRILERDELYRAASAMLGIPERAIIAEYGMTELTSQFYDAPSARGTGPRIKAAPSWLRSYAIDAHGTICPHGEIGRLVHVDLANRSSAIAVATEDLGYTVPAHEDGHRFVLLGRPSDAPLRGCSLDAETLEARASI